MDKYLKIYDSYKKIVGENHSFTNHELKKILFHLVKNHQRSKMYSSLEKGGETTQYVVQSGIDGYIQVDEFKDGTYNALINLGLGDYNYFGSDRFIQLFEHNF